MEFGALGDRMKCYQRKDRDCAFVVGARMLSAKSGDK